MKLNPFLLTASVLFSQPWKPQSTFAAGLTPLDTPLACSQTVFVFVAVIPTCHDAIRIHLGCSTSQNPRVFSWVMSVCMFTPCQFVCFCSLLDCENILIEGNDHQTLWSRSSRAERSQSEGARGADRWRGAAAKVQKPGKQVKRCCSTRLLWRTCVL